MKKLKGIAFIVAAAVCWGVFPMFSRLLYAGGARVIEAVAMRAYIAAAIYLVMGIIKGSFKGLKARDMAFFLFYGLSAICSTYVFYALAIERLSSAAAAMLLYTAPAFVILLSRVFYAERITPVKLIALCMTFCGSFFVVRGYDFSAFKVNALGIVFGLLSGLGYSMLTVIGKKGLERYAPETNTFLPTIFTALVLLPAAPPWEIKVCSVEMALCFLGIGIIGSVLPYIFYLRGLSLGVDGGSASLLANIEPLVATILGAVCFADSLEPAQIAGIAVTLCGAALPSAVERKSQTAS